MGGIEICLYARPLRLIVLQSSPGTTALIIMADSNKRKAGKDVAGGAAFKKKKVSRGVDRPSRRPVVRDSPKVPQRHGLGQPRLQVP